MVLERMAGVIGDENRGIEERLWENIISAVKCRTVKTETEAEESSVSSADSEYKGDALEAVLGEKLSCEVSKIVFKDHRRLLLNWGPATWRWRNTIHYGNKRMSLFPS